MVEYIFKAYFNGSNALSNLPISRNVFTYDLATTANAFFAHAEAFARCSLYSSSFANNTHVSVISRNRSPSFSEPNETLPSSSSSPFLLPPLQFGPPKPSLLFFLFVFFCPVRSLFFFFSSSSFSFSSPARSSFSSSSPFARSTSRVSAIVRSFSRNREKTVASSSSDDDVLFRSSTKNRL